jgi:hypothetical protein
MDVDDVAVQVADIGFTDARAGEAGGEVLGLMTLSATHTSHAGRTGIVIRL